MGCDDHGTALPQMATDCRIHGLAAGGIKIGLGLIQQPELGPREQNPGEGRATLLACRKLPDVQVGATAKAGQFQDLVDLAT